MKRPTPRKWAAIEQAMANEWRCSLQDAAEVMVSFFPVPVRR